MLLTNQQKFLIDAIRRLGCVREDQLIALLRPVFCARRPDMAPQVVRAAMRQLRYCNVEFQRKGDVYLAPNACADPALLEALDVMLELSKGRKTDFRRCDPPVHLRFTVQEKQDVRTFAVASLTTQPQAVEFFPGERLILLWNGQGKPHPLPVPNRQFFAVQQGDGTHRFFAADSS